jgi:hypothetical protein
VSAPASVATVSLSQRWRVYIDLRPFSFLIGGCEPEYADTIGSEEEIFDGRKSQL